MIEKTNSFKTSDGQIHGTIEQAQQHAISNIVLIDVELAPDIKSAVAGAILGSKDQVLAILKLKARKPKAAKPKTPKAPKVTVAK